MEENSTYTAIRKADFTLSSRSMDVNFGLNTDKKQFNEIKHILKTGECEGAVVISRYPLFIAAYAAEMDAVVLLDFSKKKLEWLNRNLQVKGRLITINGYEKDSKLEKLGRIQKDLVPGPSATYQWQKVHPIIADFVVEEKYKLEDIKDEFPEGYWDYIYELGNAYFQYDKLSARSGIPNNSDLAYFTIKLDKYYKSIYGEDYEPELPPGYVKEDKNANKSANKNTNTNTNENINKDTNEDTNDNRNENAKSNKNVNTNKGNGKFWPILITIIVFIVYLFSKNPEDKELMNIIKTLTKVLF